MTNEEAAMAARMEQVLALVRAAAEGLIDADRPPGTPVIDPFMFGVGIDLLDGAEHDEGELVEVAAGAVMLLADAIATERRRESDRLLAQPVTEDVRRACAELYDSLPGAANRDARLDAAVALAAHLTEQRVREEMAAKYLESVNLLVAQHAAKMARADTAHADALAHNEKVHLAAVGRIGAANDARIRALKTDLAQARDLNRELAARSQYLKSETERMAPAYRMIADLDRCQHGRHEGDSCSVCPGGRSTGGPLAYPSVISAYDYAGQPYAMPERGKRCRAEEWLHEGRRVAAGGANRPPEMP